MSCGQVNIQPHDANSSLSFEAEVPDDLVYKHPAKPNQPVWIVGPLKEWGTFVPYTSVNSPDIICHVAARPGPGTLRIAAGEDLTITWNMWPKGHPGFIMNYLANCNGPCKDAKKEDLEWFKISEGGMIPGSPPAGEPRSERYVTDDLVDQGNSSSVKIPNVVPGFYALRHELIALHQTDTKDRSDFGAQFYPYCISLEITGSGTARPAGIRGTELYNADEPGFNVNVYLPVKNLTIPGPPLANIESGPQAKASASSTQASSGEETIVAAAAMSSASSEASSSTTTDNQAYQSTTEPTSSSTTSSTSAPATTADAQATQTTASATSPSSSEQAPEEYYNTQQGPSQDASSSDQDVKGDATSTSVTAPLSTATPSLDSGSSNNGTETRPRTGHGRFRHHRYRKVFRCSTGFSTAYVARPTGYVQN